jgi:hypothetical protein
MLFFLACTWSHAVFGVYPSAPFAGIAVCHSLSDTLISFDLFSVYALTLVASVVPISVLTLPLPIPSASFVLEVYCFENPHEVCPID